MFPESMQKAFTHLCNYRKGVLSLCPPTVGNDISKPSFFMELDLNYFWPNLFVWTFFLPHKNFPQKTNKQTYQTNKNNNKKPNQTKTKWQQQLVLEGNFTAIS